LILQAVSKNGGNISNEKVQLFYMVFGCVFAYGCLWFGAANDPFYDTDEYRADGGDGTQNWFYSVVRLISSRTAFQSRRQSVSPRRDGVYERRQR